jgi:ElaB/YqjD/DUF883 family membrane-anchored ribosome-binding protein
MPRQNMRENLKADQLNAGETMRIGNIPVAGPLLLYQSAYLNARTNMSGFETLKNGQDGTTAQDNATVKESFDKVIKEFRDLTTAFDELVAAGSSQDKLEEMRDQAIAKVDEAKEMATHLSRNALQQTREAAAKAGEYVRENPMSAAAIAAGLGMVAGLLLHRHRR